MDNRYAGELGTDVYDVSFNEMSLGHFGLSEAQTIASNTTGILATEALITTVKTKAIVTTMPYARNLTVVASKAAAASAKVVVNGTDIDNKPISESFTLNGATPVIGAKAFKTVTSAVLPIKATDETVSIGWGELIGLPIRLAQAPLTFVLKDGVADTAPTFTTDTTDLSKNTIDFNGSLAGKVYDVFLVL